MYKSTSASADTSIKGQPTRLIPNKRSRSSTIPVPKSRDSTVASRRRCQSLSPSTGFVQPKGDQRNPNTKPPLRPFKFLQNDIPRGGPERDALKPNQLMRPEMENMLCPIGSDKGCNLPQCVVIKILRALATKKRDFMKLRKGVIIQQNNLLEQYAALKEMENKVGSPIDDTLGEVRILSVTKWPAHDLLLLVRDDLRMPMDSEIGGIFGPQVLQQLHAQLTPIPEEVLGIGAEVTARRIDLLNLMRGRNLRERLSYNANLEWKAKNTELDHDTERLHRLVAGTVESIKARISYSLELAKVPWLDRDALVKKSERLQKENTMLVHKLEKLNKTEGGCDVKESNYSSVSNVPYQQQTTEEELKKERAAREALKDVVSAAESMLRVARARIATLEKQLKDTKTELEAARRKQKELEQLVKNSQCTYRHRETSFDARSKRLLENSKTGELTIETLSRQRDALEIRVKELREQAEIAEKVAESKEAELRSKVESLQAKMIDQEKKREATEAKLRVTEDRCNKLEEKMANLRDNSSRLIELERKCCLDYIPSKESEPTDRETEIWKELQSTRLALESTQEKLRLARADKDDFLNSLSKIAADGADNIKDKISAVLLDREQKINQMQHIIETQKENEKVIKERLEQFENETSSLRLEIKRLRNYDCFSKEIPFQELQTELLDLHMQVESLKRERSALVTAAASRALMLERHERAADLFTRITRARRDIAGLLEGRTDPPSLNEATQAEASRSLSSLGATAAETWSALCAERARVLRLESAVLSQSLQLEREGHARMQLEQHRALLEREVQRTQATSIYLSSADQPTRSQVPDMYRYR